MTPKPQVVPGSLHPQRIAIVRPSALGDVCRTVPVLTSLRAAYPDARIDWVVQDDFAPAIAAHPALNEIISFPRSQFARWWKSPGQSLQMLKWFGALRTPRYDLVLDCQGLGRSGFMTWISGAAQRVGLRSAREFGWLGYNLRLPRTDSAPLPRHTVDQMLLLVEGLGIPTIRDMRLYVADADRAWWESKRAELSFLEASYAVLAPTSRWLSKRWPIERFAQLIDPLRQRGFEKIVVIGAPREVEQVKRLFEQGGGARSPLVDLVGKATIGQSMAVIAGADLVVANDSAPLHIAVGFDRPCVGLFGPTDPAEVGPYQRPDAIVRGYVATPGEIINFKSARLGDRLMRLISTASVIGRIDDVLAPPPANEIRRATPQAAGARA